MYIKKSHKIIAWGCGTVSVLAVVAVVVISAIFSSLFGGEVEPMEANYEIDEIPFQTGTDDLGHQRLC